MLDRTTISAWPVNQHILLAPQAHLAVLLIDMTQLEPDIERCQGSRRVLEDIFEALCVSYLSYDDRETSSSHPSWP